METYSISMTHGGVVITKEINGLPTDNKVFVRTPDKTSARFWVFEAQLSQDVLKGMYLASIMPNISFRQE